MGNSPIVPHWEPIYLYGVHEIGTKSTFTPDVFTAKVLRGGGAKGLRGRESWATFDAADHPTPKPEPLWRALLEAFGQLPGPVLDPFAGGGTTMRVCKDAARAVVGIEVERRFCDLIVDRSAQEVLDLSGAA
jgi:hypothetical protein